MENILQPGIPRSWRPHCWIWNQYVPINLFIFHRGIDLNFLVELNEHYVIALVIYKIIWNLR